MAVITISKEYAAGTGEFVKQLADRLDYSILDRELVTQASRQLEAASAASGVKKDKESRLLRLIDAFTADAIKKVIDRSYGRLDSDAYFKATSKLIMEAAQADNVVIVGWGGQCILRDHSRAVHVRIVKRLEERVERLMADLAIDEHDARELIQREERESAAYIKHCFNQDWDDAHLYHMVFNLSRVPVDQAAGLVAMWVVQQRMP